MKRLALAAAGLSALLLAACATTAAPPAEEADASTVVADEPQREGASAYGYYLAGKAALADGRNEDAARYFGLAGKAGGEASSIKERGFQAALFAGDIPRAAQTAPLEGEASSAFVRLGELTKVVDALKRGDGKTAQAGLAENLGFLPGGAHALLKPWTALAAGDKAAMVTRPESSGDRLADIYTQLNQALLYERGRRFDEAETNFKMLMGLGDASVLFAPDYGAFLERRKRYADALTVYDQALALTPNDPELKAARARAAKKGKAPAMLTPAQGGARGLAIAASSMMGDKQYGLALIYLRLSAYLDPERDETWILLGDTLIESDDPEGARTAYAKIKASSRYYAGARAKMAWSLQGGGDKVGALEMAKRAVDAAPEDREALVTYADILRANDRYAEAVAVLDKVLASDEARADWRLLFMRGIARDRSGDWAGAEADLQAALKLQPENADVLNYLGYAWIDRGERLNEAMGMVQKAVDAEPRNGAIVDSLGWAYFRTGDYRKAVEQLERAVSLEPADPEINDHLGDAYWMVGRQIEARFQWTRVLQLEPNAAMKARAEEKLKSGLIGVKPVVADAR